MGCNFTLRNISSPPSIMFSYRDVSIERGGASGVGPSNTILPSPEPATHGRSSARRSTPSWGANRNTGAEKFTVNASRDHGRIGRDLYWGETARQWGPINGTRSVAGSVVAGPLVVEGELQFGAPDAASFGEVGTPSGMTASGLVPTPLPRETFEPACSAIPACSS